jgi:tetratricopeptide (TPR) repeat protein
VVHLDTVTLPVAALGPDNPLPPLAPPRPVTPLVDASAADPDMARNLAYGRPVTLLPYTVQDGYTRDLADAKVTVAVVDNGVVRAEFLLDFGGRMRSLVHLPTGRELLHRNPILQPANLGLRNAWFAGGVEWNLGTTGHTPLTCAPVHAARVVRPDGVEVLRMWEFERNRELVYQIDAYAPEGSALLHVHVRIINPNAHEVPVYWWSNIAVPETADTRVLAPADAAYHLAYDGVLRRVPIPVHDGVDRSYPAHARHAADYFYDIAPPRRRWIAALDGDGSGLVQASTDRLRGRKLFLWGQSGGGRRWQEWLSPADQPYLEIQAGLARTQLEHLPMPAGAQWSWLEVYGLLTADAARTSDWDGACTAVEEALEELIPRHLVDAEHDAARQWLDQPPTEQLHDGSGWGALERLHRSATGDSSLELPGVPFDTTGDEQDPWLALLATGDIPLEAPLSYQVTPGWRQRLEHAGDTWLIWLHRGVARWHAGEADAARDAWRASLAARDNPWALRNLAVCDENADSAASSLLRAGEMLPTPLRALTVETLQALLAADRPAEALALVDGLPPDLRADGRIQMLECKAAIAVGCLDRAGRLIEAGIVVADLREGEDALDQLWFAYHERRDPTLPRTAHPLPRSYDFRMAEG